MRLLLVATSLAAAVVSSSAAPAVREKKRRAWVSILTGECYNNTMLLETQIASIKRHSRYDHAVMVLPEVGEATREHLLELGSTVIPVDPIHPPDDLNNAFYDKAFSKLNVWKLTDYDQVAYLDADAYLTGPKSDFLFDECGPNTDFCGVERLGPDHEKRDKDKDEPTTWINTGVMVVRPNKDRFEYMVHQRLPWGLKNPVYCEEGFLSELLSGDSGDADSQGQGQGLLGSFKILDWRYNTCSEAYFDHVGRCLGESNSFIFKFPTTEFADCFNPVYHQVAIVHHCAAYRLNHETLCSQNEEEDEDSSSSESEDPNGLSNNLCRLDLLTDFQDLMLQANPCAIGGQSRASCEAAAVEGGGEGGKCQWCGDNVRCIPAGRKCHANSEETKTLIFREKEIFGEWQRIRDANLGKKNEDREEVWVTVLTGESYNNTMLIATQILSVKQHSSKKHVTMVLPEISEETRSYLSSFGTKVVEVPAIVPPGGVESPWYNNIYAKLNIWGLTDYYKVAYLDADAFLVDKSSDDVFRFCDEADYCAVERLESSRVPEGYPNPWLNGGFMVVKPNKERYEYLQGRLQQPFSFQEFLDEAFYVAVIAEGEKGLGKALLIDWRFNTCSQPFFDKYDTCIAETDTDYWKEPNPDFVQCFNKALSDTAIVHHCGGFRLTHEDLCLWDIDHEKPFCDLDFVRSFQDLMLQANPCSIGGTSEELCASYGSGKCQWCGDDVRCIPSRSHCHNDSPDSKTLATRANIVKSEWQSKKEEASTKRRLRESVDPAIGRQEQEKVVTSVSNSKKCMRRCKRKKGFFRRRKQGKFCAKICPPASPMVSSSASSSVTPSPMVSSSASSTPMVSSSASSSASSSVTPSPG